MADSPEAGSPKGRLSIVATPIGNMEDITLRALRILGEADRILAEDTRRTRALCRQHQIATPLSAYHAHSPAVATERILEEIAGGQHLALVSDAGMPLVSDPGADLVQQAQDRGLLVEVIPGPSAVAAAVAVCGLRADSFRFEGFVPRSGRRRREALQRVATEPAATVLFEAPSRLLATLADLDQVLASGRRVGVCRELTKLHEQVVRGTPAEVAAAFESGVKGEITLVVEAHTPNETPDLEALDNHIRGCLQRGASVRDTVAELSAPGLSRSDIYARVQTLKDARDPGDEYES